MIVQFFRMDAKRSSDIRYYVPEKWRFVKRPILEKMNLRLKFEYETYGVLLHAPAEIYFWTLEGASISFKLILKSYV